MFSLTDLSAFAVKEMTFVQHAALTALAAIASADASIHEIGHDHPQLAAAIVAAAKQRGIDIPTVESLILKEARDLQIELGSATAEG